MEMEMEMIAQRNRHFGCFKNLNNGHIFDARDVEILSNRFSPQELRGEIHNASIEEAACRQSGNEWGDYWTDFKQACYLALNKQKEMEIADGIE